MPENFILRKQEGLFCVPGNFFIDPSKAVPVSVVSHAHADHAAKGSYKVYATYNTSLLMKARYGDRAAGEFHTFSYRESFEINGVKVTFYPAGHMLGSAQVLLEFGGKTFLYTGDFKLQQDKSCEAFEFVPADFLITETTYAN